MVWYRWENLESIFFKLFSLFYPEKVKNIKKKFKFFHAFANLWDSGKSAALELKPKNFLILYLLIISFKNIYSFEFDRRTDGQTDRLKTYIYTDFISHLTRNTTHNKRSALFQPKSDENFACY